MSERLKCEVCGRDDLLRLTRHLREMHGISPEQYLQEHPTSLLEAVPTRIPTCSSCGDPVVGYNPRAANVKCGKCRVTLAKRRKGEQPGLVTCRICGVSRRRLGEHLLVEHNLTSEEYLERFRDALLDAEGTRARSEACRTKQSLSAKKRWQKPGEREAASERMKVSAPWKDKRLSEEHRTAISKGGRGVPHDISDERRTALAERGRKVLEKARQDPSYSERLSEAARQRALRDKTLGFRNPEIRKKSLASRIANGTLIPPNGGRGICGFRVGIPHYCRSTLEANFARVLAHFGVRYSYEPKVFKLTTGAHYVPDFFLENQVPGYPIGPGWVELKGWRKADGTVSSQEKIETFQEEHQTSVTIIAERDELWVTVTMEVGPLIPLWERPGRNFKTHPKLFKAKGSVLERASHVSSYPHPGEEASQAHQIGTQI